MPTLGDRRVWPLDGSPEAPEPPSPFLRRDPDGIWRASGSRPVAYPDDGSERSFLVEDSSFWFQHRNDCIAAVARRFPPNGLVLDVGGGNGCVTRRLIQEGFPTALLEPSPVGARNAKIHRRLPLVVSATLEDARLEPGSLGAVGMFDVLEHVEDDRGFLDRVSRLLRPGGFLYLTVPAWDWLWSWNDVDAQHCRRYRLGPLSSLVEERFDVLYATHFFTVLVGPLLLLRSLPFRLGLARRGSMIRTETEHGGLSGKATPWIRTLFSWELDRIRAGRSIPLGTSLLMVAQRPGGERRSG
jgi:SAM-dependent methyltransferase